VVIVPLGFVIQHAQFDLHGSLVRRDVDLEVE
jgi:hypothetical protein